MRYQLAALFLMLPLGAFAQDVAAPNPADQKPAPNPENATVSAPAPDPNAPKPVKIICVKMAADTGSHMGGSKECHTEQQWDMIHRKGETMFREYDRIQNQASPNPGR